MLAKSSAAKVKEEEEDEEAEAMLHYLDQKSHHHNLAPSGITPLLILSILMAIVTSVAKHCLLLSLPAIHTHEQTTGT